MVVATEPEVVGRGKLVCGRGGEGVLRPANTVEEVLELSGAPDLARTFVVTDSPSAAGVVPLLGSVAGIICRTGGLNSHIALLAREFGICCVLATEFVGTSFDGQAVVIADDGRLIRA